MEQRAFHWRSVWLVLAVVVFIYLPITRHDLHSDDFSRIQDNAELSAAYFRSLLFDNKSDGFYRPLNHLTFGLTYHFFGLNSYAYGWFNFILLASSACLLLRIAVELFQDERFALLLVVGWLTNVKVISATLTWAVGRTTGLYTLFALIALYAILQSSHKNPLLCLISVCMAMSLSLLSKESAVVLCVFILLTALYQKRHTDRVRGWHIAIL